ncbi:MAG: hypothetical protein K0R76_712 [Alphaproteobacteria bacterium]|jgi:hypothetical protein|nr:hypothetical protein [Alphaproteobacteria bacterium]
MAKNQKKPKHLDISQPRKIPHIKSKDVEFAEGKPIAWRFSTADKNGQWAWPKLDIPGDYKEVLEKLYEFENYNIKQLLNTGSHPIPIEDLSTNAQQRLKKIEKDDLDALYSFRIRGKERVWCIQSANIMKILWWDPNHEVCPSLKKHT